MNLPDLKIGEFLNSMLSDNSGGISTMRVILVLTMAAVLTVWLHAAFTSPPGIIPELPTNVLGLLGVLIGAKAIQRIGEKAEENPTPPTA